MKVNDIMPRNSADVTDQVIEAWKKAYPTGVFELSTGNLKAWLRKPTRNEMKELTAKSNSGTDPVTYTEIVVDMLWLGGDEAIKTDDEAFYAIMPEVQNVLEIKEASLKKL